MPSRASSTNASTPRITWGVELEFLVPSPLEDVEDLRPADPRWPTQPVDQFGDMATKASHALHAAGIPCTRDFSGTVDTAGYIASLPVRKLSGVRPTHAAWYATTDPSLSVTDHDRVADRVADRVWIAGVELVSRVFDRWDDFTHELDTVTAAVTHNLRTAVNGSCGMHVHVALAHPTGPDNPAHPPKQPSDPPEPAPSHTMSLLTAKKTLTAYLVLEPALYALVAPHRTGATHSRPVLEASTVVCGRGFRDSNTDGAEMAAHVPDPGRGRLSDLKLRKVLRRLWAAESMRELQRLTHNNQGATRCGIAVDRRHGTLEFRQLQGSLDPALVKAWTEVVIGVAKVGGLGEREFGMKLRRLADLAGVGGVSPLAMLFTLGAEEAALYFAARRKAEEKERYLRGDGEDEGVVLDWEQSGEEGVGLLHWVPPQGEAPVMQENKGCFCSYVKKASKAARRRERWRHIYTSPVRLVRRLGCGLGCARGCSPSSETEGEAYPW